MSINSNTKIIEREVYSDILDWLEEPEIIAISGPRQSGKTTLLKQIQAKLEAENVVYVNFEETSNVESFLVSPDEFVYSYSKKSQKTYFLFDEFQYVKNGGRLLKLLFDKYPNTKFIITGSSSLKIRQIASYLVGRVVFFRLFPLSFGEYLSYTNEAVYRYWKRQHKMLMSLLSHEEVKIPKLIYRSELEGALNAYIIHGGYPAVVKSESEGKKEKRLLSLIETYIERDIVKNLKIGRYLEFKNFTRAVSANVGNVINFSSLGDDVSLLYREIKAYSGVLEQTYVAKFVPAFFRNIASEIKKAPKAYFYDLGLRNTLISDFRELGLRPDKGAVVENFVFQNLACRYGAGDIHYWRTKQGAEVDFVVTLKNSAVPIEVKYQKQGVLRISKSYASFLNAYKPPIGLVLTGGYSGVEKIGDSKIYFVPVYFV